LFLLDIYSCQASRQGKEGLMKRFIKIGLSIFCLLALSPFLIFLINGITKEQLRLERQKLALNFVEQMNRNQQNYFSKRQIFANSIEDLDLNQPVFKLSGSDLAGNGLVMDDRALSARCFKHRYYIEQRLTKFGNAVLNYAKVQTQAVRWVGIITRTI
jgi:hypothetical protein